MEARFEFFYGRGYLYYNRSLIIYTEHEYNKELNEYIKQNYADISARFRKIGKFFLYIPMLSELLDEASLSYITGQRSLDIISPKSTSDALKYITTREVYYNIPYPSLTFFGESDVVGFRLDIFGSPQEAFDAYFDSFEHETSSGRKSVLGPSEDSGVRFRRKDYLEIDKEELEGEIRQIEKKLSNDDKKLIDQARENVSKLLQKGLSIDLIYSLIEPQLQLSSLVITKDFKIFLPEFDNMEIVLGPLEKTVFLFFLRHPEGVNFKDLIDHKDELTKIYRCLTNRIETILKQRSISALVDPTNNSMSEKCSRIRRVFLSKLAVPLASKYYITGKQGKDKKIEIDRSLVKWECEI